MSVSILLLLILQALWLQNSYEKAFYDLRRESNQLFRSTLFSIRDSLFLKNVRALPSDSLLHSKIEAVQIFKNPGKGKDSVRVSMKSSNVQVFVKGDLKNNDSIIDALRPMAQNFSFHPQDGKRFVIQIAPDTISLDSLKKKFGNTLAEARLPLKFLVHQELTANDGAGPMRIRMDATPLENLSEPRFNIYRDTIKLEAVRLNPISRYSASLFNFKGFILQAIAPQILFSLLLTCVTIVAFIVLYKSLRSQQRLMELKNDFISNMTHELKTPVATVSVALEALKNFHGLDDPTRTKEYLEIAQNELNRLTLMTDKILKAGAFENNVVTIERKPVDIHLVTRQILDSMKLLFEKKSAVVNFETQGTHFEAEGEASHLTNVIYNLVDNALKYSPQQPMIQVLLKEDQNNVVLTVQDNGLGIPSEFQTKIFEKFFRVPTGDIHNIKGYGLGLSYVAAVIKAHQGSIHVDSEPGNGSTFTISLPKVHG